MQIKISNCNNIDSADLKIEEKKLNIMFAPNGTGKRTIAKALTYNDNENKLSDLTPFKLRANNPDKIKPQIYTSKALRNIMCFNEEYVSQFTFQPDKILSNSQQFPVT
jgi:predicted ATP-binding protein involved in virulence